MNSLFYSPARRVLKISELVDEVFGYLEKPSIANNAQVCKQWSEIAFDCLWREVDHPFHLFNKLSPLESGDENYVSLRQIERRVNR